MKEADNDLPQSPRKNAEIIQNLPSKYQMWVKWHGFFFKQECHDLSEFRSRWQCAHGKGGWWAIVFATSISMMDFKGFTGDFQWNQRVNFIRFFQFRILFPRETKFLSASWFTKSHRQFIYVKTQVLPLWYLWKCLTQKKFSDRLSETPHDIVEKYSCSSDQKDFMFSDCTEIANGKLCQSTADNNSDSNSHSIVCDFVSFYRWETPDKHVTKVRMYVLVYHWRSCQSI